MAEPSPQDIQEHVSRARQNAWAQTASQQQPFHPTGGSYASPPLPTLPIQQDRIKTKELTVNMSNFSLIAISFSLMFLGALTFLSGFLLGIWFAGPSTPSVVMSSGEGFTLGFLPSQQSQPFQQNEAVPSQGNTTTHNLAEQARKAIPSAISTATIPNLPSFLAPFVTSAQSAIGQQSGYKTQQQLNHQKEQARSSPLQTQHSSPQQSQRSTPYHSVTPSHLHTDEFPPPVIAPQNGTSYQPSSFPQGSIPLSQGRNEDYTIQLGVYASKDNANSLVNDLQGLSFSSYITESKASDGTNLYYVHSGSYKDYTTALEAASKFASQNIPGAIVVKVSQENKNAL